jgi:hypothetical protein
MERSDLSVLRRSLLTERPLQNDGYCRPPMLAPGRPLGAVLLVVTDDHRQTPIEFEALDMTLKAA